MGTSYSPKVATSGLTCYIDAANSKCLTSTSNSAVDLTGNGFNGILRNASGVQTSLGSMNTMLTYDTSDIPGTACLNFLGFGDSTQGYLEFSSHPLGGATQCSLESWFKIVAATPIADFNVIFYSSSPDVNTQEFGLIVQNTIADPDVGIEINNDWSAGASEVRPGVGWHHFALTFDGSSARLYVDGVLSYTRAASNAALPTSGWNWIGVGQWANSGYNGANGYTQGKLGTLSFYNRALTAAEVGQNFTALRGRYRV
jgi:hypothetical protein